MAIQNEFINIIIPRKVVEDKYPGGWDQYLKDYEHVIGGRIWFDEYLVRDGAMNPMDAEALIQYWESLGLQMHSDENRTDWVDACVFELTAPTLACSWIAYDGETNSIYMAGTEPGEVRGRTRF